MFDKGPIVAGNPKAKGNQRCLYAKDSRINLPPFYSTNTAIADLLKQIEVGVGPARGHAKAATAEGELARAGAEALTRNQLVVDDVEKAINGKDLGKILVQWAE